MKQVLVLLLVIATVFVPTPARACSCAPMIDEEATAQSKVVFAGTLTETREPLIAFGDKELTYVFDVDTVVKGAVHERAIMKNQVGERYPCGGELEEGLRYLVFGDDPERLSYSICSATHPVFANGHIEGAPPLSGGPELPPDPRRTILIVGTAIVAGALLLKWKRRDPLKR